jgi:hypothetical protein
LRRDAIAANILSLDEIFLTDAIIEAVCNLPADGLPEDTNKDREPAFGSPCINSLGATHEL